MAYQPKSYRKFVATAATATLVASAIAPVAGAASNFTDVAPKYKDAVDYLVANNITQGATATTFGTHENIKRGDLAIWLAKALKLDTASAPASGFADTKGTRYDASVSVLKAKGIVSGKSETSYEPSAYVTRGEMAIMLSRAYDLTSTATAPFTDMGAYAPYINGLFEYEITTGKTPTTFGTALNITRGDLAIFLKRAAEVVKTPVVVSSTAVNGKELVVKFNQAIDKTDLSGKVSLTGVTFDETKTVVSDDAKTVTLTVAGTGVIDVTNATLEIAPIKTKANADVKTAKYVTLFSYKDSSAPAVAKIEAKGTEAVVTFNEALATEGTVSLDGAVLSSTASTTAPYYVVSGKTLTVKNLVAEKSYKLDVVGAKDAAGNMSGQITVNFTVAKPVVDSSKPAVSTSVSGNKLTLSFSEEVTEGTVTVGGVAVDPAFVVASEDKKTYTVDVQQAGLFGGTTFFTREVVVNNFADTSANKMDEVKFNATFTADTTAPRFVSASIKTLVKDDANSTADLDVILVTFDDAVKAGDLSGAGELVIKSIDGIFQSNNTVDLTTANVAYGYDVDGKDGIKGNEANVVAIAFDAKEKTSYSFELAGKVVADTYNNKVADTVSFSAVAPEYSTTPSSDLKDVTFSVPTYNNTDITLQFNKNMSDSAVNASNYTLGGKALPAGTTVKFVDNRSKVVITLPQGSITANGSYALVGTNLTDVNGNTLVNGKVSTTLTLKENVVPTATSVVLADSKNFTVNFSEALVDTTTVTGVTVKVNGTVVTPATLAVVGGDLKVTTADNLKTTDSITVEFKDTNLVDANGNKVANSTVSK
ncbi:S-layer homology domain-containing protein [Bacillus sp. ISL-45]|uniref:S-layer homology domain-containing protein n=1 Tax=Bacillus sp. ISL-45 TaxID=2819128 RepID=UPI001BE7711D|nr:S-layer homology domain-containing protein [Bacillus sp. ISL-45]MBT2661578.1 S-layer homology domain-containing protein [Bacillus sp. ISL-45]